MQSLLKAGHAISLKQMILGQFDGCLQIYTRVYKRQAYSGSESENLSRCKSLSSKSSQERCKSATTLREIFFSELIFTSRKEIMASP